MQWCKQGEQISFDRFEQSDKRFNVVNVSDVLK